MKRAIGLYFTGLAVLAAFFLITAIFQWTPWHAILSLALQGYCAIAMLYHAFKAISNFPAWLALSLAIMIQWLNNIARYVAPSFWPPDQTSESLFSILSPLPGFLICTATVFLFISQKRRFNQIQFVLDALATVGLAATFLWLVFIEPNINYFFHTAGRASTVSLLIITGDSFILTCLFLFAVTIELKRVPLPLMMVLAGPIVFAAGNMAYHYQILSGVSSQGVGPAISLLNFIYFAAIMLMTIGMLLTVRSKFILAMPGKLVYENSRSNRKIILLLFTPLLITLISGEVELQVYLATTGVILLHQIFTIYVQNGIRNENMLQMEKQYNEQLEIGILERTEKLTQSNIALDRMAKEDSVTGLYNRRFFLEELDVLVAKHKKGDVIVIAYIDIDQFKTINDSYGHDIGDEILQDIAGLLSRVKPDGALLARFGGDEFVMASPVHEQKLDAEDLSRDILLKIEGSDFIHKYGFKVSASIGVTVFPRDGADRRSIMKNADIALSHAKFLGLNRFVVFNKEINAQLLRKNEIKMALMRANYDKEFALHFQPQVQLPDMAVIGTEALLRWRSPILGQVSPGEFIPIAEESGLILQIGRWVVENAILQIKKWNIDYGAALKVSINISARQLVDEQFYSLLSSLGEEHRISPEWVDLEITEHSAMNSENILIDKFHQLSQNGTSISIDDFGTGYSSLSLLRQFDVDRLKIAKSLIDNLAEDKESYMIVRAIIAMSSALGIRTIAEGVETQEQLKALIELSCDEIQGYYFSKPLPADEFFERYLKKNSHAV